MRIDPKAGHPAMDYAEHTKTYNLFLKGSLYLLICVVAIMAFLAIFVA
jgi:aa3 type cytochrome c oxidase subunit IV